MNLSKIAWLSLLFAVGFSLTVGYSQSPAVTEIAGTVFIDKNENGKLDEDEISRSTATVWLYQVQSNGLRKKIGKVVTSPDGEYRFPAQEPGNYEIVVRFDDSFFVGRRTFALGGAPLETLDIPYMTKQTAGIYGAFNWTGNPANVEGENPVSPFAP